MTSCNQGEGIHPLSHRDADCLIGEGTRVWQFASITRRAEIGRDCVIAPFTVIDGAWLGNRVHVMSGVFLDPGIVIGSDVFIGPNATFCNDAWPRVDTHGFDINQCWERTCTIVGDKASIGANAVILPGVSIGHSAMVAAGARVSKDLLAHHMALPDGRQVEITDETKRLEGRMRFVDLRRLSLGPDASALG